MSNFAKLQELLKQKKNAIKGAGKTIKPKQGQNRYVILPSWRGGDEVQFWHDFGIHYIKDAADQTKAVYLCTSETFGKPCAICDGLAEVQRTTGAANPDVAELVKKGRAGVRYLVNVLALDTESPDAPQVLELGKTAFANLLTVIEEWGEQVFDPANPQIVVIERTGTTTTDTRYTVQPSPKRHALKGKVTPVNLDEFVAQENDEMQKKALSALQHVTTSALTATGDRPRLAQPQAKPVSDDDFQDIPDSVTMHSASTPAAQAPARPAAPVMTDDIDSLLDDIEAGVKV